MLSEASKQGIAQALQRAAKAGLLRESEHAIDIRSADFSAPQDCAGQLVFAITATSFAFRLMTLFHVSLTPESRAYYGEAEITEQRFAEVFAEVVNLFGGALNRELSNRIPHLGLSIPYLLRADCLKHVAEMKPEHVSGYAITINHSVQLQVTMCMSCSGPVDIPVTEAAIDAKAGELELF